MIKYRKLFGLALWAAAAFAFIMAVLPHPPQVLEANDKYQHMLAFSTLTVLACLAYPPSTRLRIAVLLAGFGAAIEFVQAIPALHRDADIHDWLADMLAVGAVMAVIAVVERLTKSDDKPA